MNGLTIAANAGCSAQWVQGCKPRPGPGLNSVGSVGVVCACSHAKHSPVRSLACLALQHGGGAWGVRTRGGQTAAEKTSAVWEWIDLHAHIPQFCIVCVYTAPTAACVAS